MQRRLGRLGGVTPAHPRVNRIIRQSRSPVDEQLVSFSANHRFLGDLVARSLGKEPGHVLDYSCRVALLEAAAKQGIERFEANLVIAVAQHRLSRTRDAAEAVRQPGGTRDWSGLIIFVVVEVVILGAAWFAVMR